MSAIGKGSRVRCIKRGAWASGYGPKLGDVCVVEDVWKHCGEAVVGLVGYSAEHTGFDGTKYLGWEARHFVPIDGDAEIERLRAAIKHPANPDAPARKRERVQ